MECAMSNETNQNVENIIKTILLVEDNSIISELLIQMITQESPIKYSRYRMD